MGFLFENLTKPPAADKEEKDNSFQENSENIKDGVRMYFEEKIEALQVKPILKKYLQQTLTKLLKEKVSDDEDEKIFLFEVRSLLRRVHKSQDPHEYTNFLSLLEELYLLGIDRDITYNHKPKVVRTEREPETLRRGPRIFMSFMHRETLLGLQEILSEELDDEN